MALWKKAITSLGLIGLLSSNAYAQGNEKKVPEPDVIAGAATVVESSVSIEQIMQTSEEAAWKIATTPFTEPGLSKPPAYLIPTEERRPKNTPPFWTIEGTRGGMAVEGFYSIPEDFTLKLGGKYGILEGHGFRWEAGEEEFYYNGYPVLENIKSVEGKRYDETITLGDKTLAEFLDKYDKERPGIEEALDDNLSELQSRLADIYLGRYDQKFIFDLFIHLLGVLPAYGRDDGELSIDEYGALGNELEEFTSSFYDDEVSEDDKRRTREAVDDFAKGMFESYKDTDTYATLKYVGKDPDNRINVGTMTLGDLEYLLGGFSDVIGIEKTRDGFRGSRTLRGRGVAHGEFSMTSGVIAGEREGEFNHSALSDNRIDAIAYADIDLRFKKGEPVYVYVTDEGLKVSLEQFGQLAGMDLHLLDAELDAEMGYLYHVKSRFSESFELSEPAGDGWQGTGIVYDEERSVLESADITLSGKFKTKDLSLSGKLHERWMLRYREHELTSLYFFKDEVCRKGWYFVSAGWQIGTEKERWRMRESETQIRIVRGKEEPKEGWTVRDGHDEQRFIFRPRVNVAGGLRQGLMSPFFAYTQLPQESLRFGMLFDIPHLPSRMYVRATLEDFMPQNPVADDTDLSAEASLVLFDEEGNRKVIESYIREELFNASPRVARIMDRNMLRSALYSDLDGILLNARAVDADLSFNGVWGTRSPLFMGLGYFGNVQEKFHGGNLILGYDVFAVDAGLATLNKEGNHGHAIKASASGKVSDLIIYLGVNGMLPTRVQDSEEDYGMLQQYLEATLNISGYFREECLLDLFSPGWWKKKLSD